MLMILSRYLFLTAVFARLTRMHQAYRQAFSHCCIIFYSSFTRKQFLQIVADWRVRVVATESTVIIINNNLFNLSYNTYNNARARARRYTFLYACVCRYMYVYENAHTGTQECTRRHIIYICRLLTIIVRILLPLCRVFFLLTLTLLALSRSIWVSDLIEDCAWSKLFDVTYIYCIFACLATNRNCLFKSWRRRREGRGLYFHSLNFVSLSIIRPIKMSNYLRI